MSQTKKLTAVKLSCRGRSVQAFLKLNCFNGKPVITQSQINELFGRCWGFTPERGETISFG